MQIRSSRLRRSPSEAALRTIDDCARDLAPQNLKLSSWHGDYVSNHRSRIAHDLDIINREIPKSNNLLEFGSIPLVLTAALKSQGYQVTGCDMAPEFLHTVGFEVTAIIYRGDYQNLLKQALIRLMPGFSPFVSYIARKPAHAR